MDTISDKEAELEYIEMQLQLHGERLTDAFIEDITGKKLIAEGNLLEELESGAWKTFKKGEQVILQFNFSDYGRLTEIASNKSKRRPVRTSSVDVNAVVWGIREKQKRKKKKDTRWYSKNVYGMQNKLIGNLMWGYSDIVMKNIKTALAAEKQIKL